MPAIATPFRYRTWRLAGTPRFWTATVALVVAGFCAASGLMLADLRRDTREQAVTGERYLAAALAQEIDRNIELLDLSLRAVAEDPSEPDLAGLGPRVQDLMIYDRTAAGGDLGAILVLDRDGRVVRGSAPGFIGTDLSDRAYFKAQKADPGPGLSISAPFHRRVTGDDQVIALSRGLHAADGSFAGLVVRTVRLSYFQEILTREDIGRRGNITLFLLDGTCLMRVPAAANDIGRSFASRANFQRFLTGTSGSFSGTGTTDGQPRIYSFARVGNLPLIVDVARAEDDVFAVWRTRTAIIGVALAALCAVAFGLGSRLMRQLERTARSERRLSDGEAEYRLLAENAQDVIVRLDPALRRRYVSPACRAVLGYEPEELIGRSPQEIIHTDDWPSVSALILSAREGRCVVEAVYRLRHRDGRIVWVEGRYSLLPDDRGFIAVLRDITLRRQAEERAAALNAELAHLANNDALTGLANRRRFDEVLDAEWRRAVRGDGPISLLLIDVDRFKLFNDSYGHQCGDACLRAVAEAVRGVTARPGDLAARYGGEEIAVILPGTDAAGAACVGERVRRAVEDLALPHDGNSRCGGIVTVSLGCATSGPEDGRRTDAGALIAAADACLYEAKRTGRNRVTASLPEASLAPIPVDEAERLAEFDAYDASGALVPSESLDRIARVAAHLLDVPIAFVSVIGRDTATLVGRHGTEIDAVPRRDAYCDHTILGDAPLVIPDTSADPRFAANPLTRGGVAFYAGAPLIVPGGGRRIGALCIADTAPRPPLDTRGRELLADLARLVMDELERRRGADAHQIPSDQTLAA